MVVVVGNSLSTVFGIYCVVEPLLVDCYILKMVMSIFFLTRLLQYMFLMLH